MLKNDIYPILSAPNPENAYHRDPLCTEIAKLYKTNKEEHDRKAAEFTRKHAM